MYVPRYYGSVECGEWRVEVMKRVLSVLCLWSGAGEAKSSKIVASWSGVRHDGCIEGGV
jgi:hypothetical protein